MATDEMVAGVRLREVKDIEEAFEWVKRCPNLMSSSSEIEIRPLFEIPEFEGALTTELQEQEERIRLNKVVV